MDMLNDQELKETNKVSSFLSFFLYFRECYINVFLLLFFWQTDVKLLERTGVRTNKLVSSFVLAFLLQGTLLTFPFSYFLLIYLWRSNQRLRIHLASLDDPLSNQNSNIFGPKKILIRTGPNRIFGPDFRIRTGPADR